MTAIFDALTARIEELERRTGALERRETSSAWRWDDLQGPATAGKTSATAPSFDYTNIGYLFPQNDTTRRLYYVFQLPHAWKEGSTIYPHIHFRQTDSATPTFKLDYSWHNIGAAIPAFTTLTMATTVVTYTSGSIHQIATNTSGISGSGKTISSLLLCKLYRDDNIVSGDVLVWAMDVHYLRDSHGSKQEYVK